MRFMKTKLEINSALIGLGIGVFVTLGLAAASSPGPVGRYQIGGTSSHGLVVDTVTGQVWEKYLPQNEGHSDADFSKPKFAPQK